ncbi:hypothetical protein AST99_13575 [Formosa algae]|nr:hypothetical protein AST99_13575 [Formosa algae]
MCDMKLFKVLFLYSIILCSISNCASQKLEKVPPVGIKEIYTQHWSSGVKSGGSGTNVFIVLDAELPQHISLDSIYFKTLQLPLAPDTRNPLLFAGRKVYPADSKYTSIKGNAVTDQKVSENIQKEPKFTLEDNQCVIQYTVSGDVKYFIYDQLYAKQSPPIPNARPKP